MVQVTGWVGDKPGWVTGGAGVRQAGDKLGGDGALRMTDRQGVWLARVLSSWLVACCSPPTLMRVHTHRHWAQSLGLRY